MTTNIKAKHSVQNLYDFIIERDSFQNEETAIKNSESFTLPLSSIRSSGG